MQTLFRRMRARYRARWSQTWPDPPFRRERNFTIVAMLIIFLMFGIAGRMDYEDELRAAAIAESARARIAEERAKQLSDDLVRCFNGQPTGHYIEAADGQRTYIVCLGVEEIHVGHPCDNIKNCKEKT